MAKAWRTVPAALLCLLSFPAFLEGQEKEVHDTPKRYRELMKDPRIRAVLEGKPLPPGGTGKGASSPGSPRGGKIPSPGKERGKGGEGKGEAKEGGKSRGAPGIPPRLKLPPPPMPEPIYRRGGFPYGRSGAGAFPGAASGEGAAPPPLGDGALWPWDPSLVGRKGGKKRTSIPSPGGKESSGKRVSSPGKEPTRGKVPSRPPGFHGLFGEEDQPGLFLQVEGSSPVKVGGKERRGGSRAKGAGRDESISPSGPVGSRELPRPGPGEREGGGRTSSFLPSPPPAGGRAAGKGDSPSAVPAGKGPSPFSGKTLPAAALPSSPSTARGTAGREGEKARKILDRMFLSLGGRKAFSALGGLHASIRIVAYDRMGAEVFSRSAEEETLAGPARGDKIEFSGGPTLGRRGEAFWATFKGVERPDMVPRGAQELRVFSFLLRFPFSLAGEELFQPLSSRPVKVDGSEWIEVVLQGRGGRATLHLEPTTCIPREVIYAPPGGKPARILLSEWRNLQGVVLPSRKAILSPDGKRVSLEIRTLQVLGGFQWGPEHFLPAAKAP